DRWQPWICCHNQDGWFAVPQKNPKALRRIPCDPDAESVCHRGSGVFEVRHQGAFFIADLEKRMIVVPPTDRSELWFYNCFEERMPLRSGDKWGVVDRDGNWVLRPKYSFVGRSAMGRQDAMQGELFGYLDREGRVVIDFQFTYVTPFRQGLAFVAKKFGKVNRFFFIREDGSAAFSGTFTGGSAFSEGRAAVRYGRSEPFGYIDLEGKQVIPPQFKAGSRFSEGLAGVVRGRPYDELDGVPEYVDRNGQTVLRFDAFPGARPGCFAGALALIDTGMKMIYINRSGEVVWMREDRWPTANPGYLYPRDMEIE
ncbi:MAG: WG repeat-containing protein, partial [Planctomycetota bacterium]